MLDSKKISLAIRAKKKALLNSTPEVVDVDTRPDADPQDVLNALQAARIEHTLDVPEEEMDSEKANLDMSDDEALSLVMKKRRERLGRNLDLMD